MCWWDLLLHFSRWESLTRHPSWPNNSRSQSRTLQLRSVCKPLPLCPLSTIIIITKINPIPLHLYPFFHIPEWSCCCFERGCRGGRLRGSSSRRGKNDRLEEDGLPAVSTAVPHQRGSAASPAALWPPQGEDGDTAGVQSASSYEYSAHCHLFSILSFNAKSKGRYWSCADLNIHVNVIYILCAWHGN